jgi:hypothetical protein
MEGSGPRVKWGMLSWGGGERLRARAEVWRRVPLCHRPRPAGLGFLPADRMAPWAKPKLADHDRATRLRGHLPSWGTRRAPIAPSRRLREYRRKILLKLKTIDDLRRKIAPAGLSKGRP